MTASMQRPGAVGPQSGIAKAPSGIRGLDAITGGGLPRGRPALITGGPGSGKTLFGVEFLVRGAEDFGEPGVLLAFEESAEDLTENVASLGFDLAGLQARGLLAVDAFRVDPTEIVTTGAFDLDGLFIRLASAVDTVGARRVVLDTIEVLFTALGDEAIVRSEFARLLRWLREQELTAVITAERGREGQLTRFGIEEYVSDCVLVLDHRMREEIATRRLRIAKFRGSAHGTNEYPFLITDGGLQIWPVTGVQLTHPASSERMSLGVPGLDEMLGGGAYRGSTVLVSGSAGTGKTTIAAHTAVAACARGETVLFVSFEESPEQLIRNMRSVGVDLRRWVDARRLRLLGQRATAFGLEEHLVRIGLLLQDSEPELVVLDSVGSLGRVGADAEVASAVARELDLLKSLGTTSLITTLTGDAEGSGALEVSSLIDTWLLLRNIESDGERNRLLFVLKSRGMAHSNQVREFLLTDSGARLLEVSVGPHGVLVGSARTAKAAEDRAATARRSAELDRQRLTVARRTAEIDAQIALLREQLATERAELEQLGADEAGDEATQAAARQALGRQRTAPLGDDGHDGAPTPPGALG
jgi:circadian clock protein KaiC